MSEMQTPETTPDSIQNMGASQINGSPLNAGLSELQKPANNPIIGIVVSILLIAAVFAVTSFLKPDDRLAMELKLGEFGKSLPEDQRYVVGNDGVKVEKFPLVYRMVKSIPYAPAYRVALYLNKSKVFQRDILKHELEKGGVLGFPLAKLKNNYTVVMEEMHGGDNIKPMSNAIEFVY
jgi:hypothetical protein